MREQQNLPEQTECLPSCRMWRDADLVVIAAHAVEQDIERFFFLLYFFLSITHFDLFWVKHGSIVFCVYSIFRRVTCRIEQIEWFLIGQQNGKSLIPSVSWFRFLRNGRRNDIKCWASFEYREITETSHILRILILPVSASILAKLVYSDLPYRMSNNMNYEQSRYQGRAS